MFHVTLLFMIRLNIIEGCYFRLLDACLPHNVHFASLQLNAVWRLQSLIVLHFFTLV